MSSSVFKTYYATLQKQVRPEEERGNNGHPLHEVPTLKPFFGVIVGKDGDEHYALSHIVLHSPTGMNWGYGGSGPADASLSILADYYGEEPTSEDLRHGTCLCYRPHQQFKWDFIAVAPKETGFEITTEVIEDWLTAKGLPLSEK